MGLFLERSPEMMIAAIGVLKAGGAYVPLDPAYPASWLKFLLDDSQAPVVLTVEKFLAQAPPHAGKSCVWIATGPRLNASALTIRTACRLRKASRI